ncbi:MAG: hypothetical protein DI529_14320 [Chryseobacterium sp.]|nr:MAG: hypothetical protein DI529_14320 [Chryseobacterium sp.]
MINIISFTIYFLITVPVIVFVGWKCFTIGRIYLLDLFRNIQICDSVNRILLIGYYLMNIGYVTFSLSEGLKTATIELFVVSMFTKTATTLLLIAVMHYINIFLLTYFRKQILLTFKS